VPNGNAVIDAGDRINSNRQSIIGRIELQPHKIRKPKSHRITWSSFRGIHDMTYSILYNLCGLHWKRRYTVPIPTEFYASTSQTCQSTSHYTNPFLIQYKYSGKRYITFSALSFSKKKNSHRIKTLIWSRLFICIDHSSHKLWRCKQLYWRTLSSLSIVKFSLSVNYW